MARTLLLQPNKADHATAFHFDTSAPATSLLLLLLLLVAAAVAAVVVSLCTSGKKAGPRKQRRSSSLAPAPQQEQEQEQDQDSGSAGSSRNKQLLASLSGISVKAAAVAKMVSWNRRSLPASGWSSGDDDAPPDGDGTAEEEALWKKTIILGDKCRPLQFSGQIAHDSDGNPMQTQPSAINKGDDAAADQG